ncbi:UNVERIFIED_CONTAM: hypothetical protein Sradi_4576500 [Sesamum radiatum]|uniref:Uncharacterized protein n=1 Tax=Sesamum radiatum TaxID=300843 RepID=A0AAW2NAR3_SESRA
MDELQGSVSTHSQYLACSVSMDQHSPSSANILEPQEKDLFEVTVDEDDTFKDALPDFLTLHDSAEIHEKDLSKGKTISNDIFYVAVSSDDSDFVSVTFLTRNPGSPDYDGIDTQVTI